MKKIRLVVLVMLLVTMAFSTAAIAEQPATQASKEHVLTLIVAYYRVEHGMAAEDVRQKCMEYVKGYSEYRKDTTGITFPFPETNASEKFQKWLLSKFMEENQFMSEPALQNYAEYGDEYREEAGRSLIYALAENMKPWNN
jgi:hypothetical protein